MLQYVWKKIPKKGNIFPEGTYSLFSNKWTKKLEVRGGREVIARAVARKRKAASIN